MDQIGSLVAAMQAETPGAREQLERAIYSELRALAAHMMKGERPGHTLQPTALAGEVWARLNGHAAFTPSSRPVLIRIAATAMKNALIDHARAKNAEKRGGGQVRVTLADADGAVDHQGVEFEQLNQALEALERDYPRQYQVVTLRYFAGMSVLEVAEWLGVAEKTVFNDWTFARAWLQRQLAPGSTTSS